MSLGNHSKKEFMARESSYSTRGSRNGKNLLGWEEDEDMSQEQTRQSLIAAKQKMVEEIILLPKSHPRRKALGKEYHEIELEILRLRPTKKSPPLGEYVVDIIKTRMTKHQWVLLLKEAEEMKERHDNSPLKDNSL